MGEEMLDNTDIHTLCCSTIIRQLQELTRWPLSSHHFSTHCVLRLLTNICIICRYSHLWHLKRSVNILFWNSRPFTGDIIRANWDVALTWVQRQVSGARGQWSPSIESCRGGQAASGLAWVNPKPMIEPISLCAFWMCRSAEIRSSCSDPSPWAGATFTDG